MKKFCLFCAVIFSCFHASGMELPEAPSVDQKGMYVYLPKKGKVWLRASTREDTSILMTNRSYLLRLLDQLSELELLFDVVHIVNDGLVRAGIKCNGSALNYYVHDDHPLLRECRREVSYSRLHPDEKKKFKDCDETECPRLSPFAAVIEGRNNMLRGSIPDHRGHLFAEGRELVHSAYKDFNKEIFGTVKSMQSEPIVECVISPGTRKSLHTLTYDDILSCSEYFRYEISRDLVHMWVSILPEMITHLVGEVKSNRVSQKTSNLVCTLLDYMAVRNARANPCARKREMTQACLYFEGWVMSSFPFSEEYRERTRSNSWRFLEVRRNVRNAVETGNALMTSSSYPREKRLPESPFRQPEGAHFREDSEERGTSRSWLRQRR